MIQRIEPWKFSSQVDILIINRQKIVIIHKACIKFLVHRLETKQFLIP